jgi:hypothetical protein
MNTLKSVFKRLTPERTELSEQQKIELATIYDDLNGALKQANSGLVQAVDLVSKAARLAKSSLSDNESLLKELDRAEGLIKQIGLDSELKKVQKAQSQVKDNISAIERYYTDLLSL